MLQRSWILVTSTLVGLGVLFGEAPEATATCILQRRGNETYSCCSPPGGPMRCHRVRARPRCDAECRAHRERRVRERRAWDRRLRDRRLRDRRLRTRNVWERRRVERALRACRNVYCRNDECRRRRSWLGERSRRRLIRRLRRKCRQARLAADPFPGRHPYWDGRGLGKLTLEFSAGGLFSWASMPALPEGTMGLGGGGVFSVGFRHRRRYSKRTPADRMGLVAILAALPTLGLIFVPKVAWLGTDRGLDLKFRSMTVTDGDRTQTSFALGLCPVFRVSRRFSRWRWPAAMHFLVPEVGVLFRRQGRHAFYVQPLRFPVSVLVDPRVGLELEAGVWFTVPMQQRPEVGVAVTTSLSVVWR